MSKCRHRKGLILANARYVEFTPDQEPFKSGVIESCGIEEIKANLITIAWCPRCHKAKDFEVDDSDWSTE